MKRDESLEVADNSELAAGIRHLRLVRDSDLTEIPRPGQFAMVQTREGASPLLRRPLSYLFADESNVEFLYRTTGVGTRILAKASPGDALAVLGPVGKGFDLSLSGRNPLIVAGGMGLAPLFFLQMRLQERGVEKIEILYGAASASELVMAEDLKIWGAKVSYATDDGGRGHKGFVTDLLKKRLEAGPPPDVIYACGPMPMLRAVANMAIEKAVPCQVSVEARMACGVGACLGCSIPAADGGYLQVCDDGPVFDAQRLFGRGANG